jgi:hypothetical protein
MEILLELSSTKAFNQKKWFKIMFTGGIEVVEVAYELKATSNKRQSCYLPVVLPSGAEVNNYTHSDPLNYSDVEVVTKSVSEDDE